MYFNNIIACLLLLSGAEFPSWKFWPSQRPLSISLDPGRRLSSFFIFIWQMSCLMFSSHLYLGLPRDLLVRGFQLNIFLTVLVSGILCMWPNQLSLWALKWLIIFLCFIGLSNSSLVLTLHIWFSSYMNPMDHYLVHKGSSLIHILSHIFVKIVLILSSRLPLMSRSNLFPSGFPNEFLYTHATCPIQLILLIFDHSSNS